MDRRLAPARAEFDWVVGTAAVASEDFALSTDWGCAEGTSTQLMSESLSLSHMSTSESEVALAGLRMLLAEGAGFEGPSGGVLVVRPRVPSVD